MALSNKALENSNIGREVCGLDPTCISDDDKVELRRLFLEYGLLVLRGLDIDEPTHIEITKSLGKTELHPVENLRLEEYPEIICSAVEARRVQALATDLTISSVRYPGIVTCLIQQL